MFAHDVDQAAGRDPGIAGLDERIAAADAAERVRLRSERAELYDATHSVERAVRAGSVRSLVEPGTLRPHLVDAVERVIERALDGHIPSGHDGTRLAYELRG